MVEYEEREKYEALGDEVELDVMNAPMEDDGDEVGDEAPAYPKDERGLVRVHAVLHL